MRLAFDQTKTNVIFVHEDANEYKFLYKFPAFLKQGPYFYAPAKVQVIYNIVERLKRSKKKLKVDQDVFDFLQQPFKLKEIPASFKFFTEPMDYQSIALRYMYTVGSGGLLLEPGMGKSKVVLDYIALMKFKKVLVVCPKALLFVWEDEIHTHRPDLTFYTVQTTDWEKEKLGVSKAQVTIINYNKAVTFKNELKAEGFEFMHLDEFLIKDPKTDRTQSLTDISYKVSYRCGGSGTLINNSIMDVFCPVRYLEPSLVGQNYKKFQDRHAVKVEVVRGDNKFNQIVNFKGKDEARSILESCCIVMTKDKWLNGKLPGKTFHDIMVPLTQEQKDAYYSLMRNYVTNINGLSIEVDNPLVMMSKLYQISNGFVYHTPPEEINEELDELLCEETKKKKKKSKRTTIFFKDAAKIKALQELLQNKIPGRRSIIWFNMEAEYQIISEMLEREGFKFLTVKGGEKDIGNKVRTFNNDPSFTYLVCQAKSVNYGITVLGTTLDKLEGDDFQIFPGISPEVHTEIFYSMNFSLEVYLQQQDRIHRLGQKHECEYYRIFALSPVEKKIRMAIEDKMSIRHDMLVDIASKIATDEDFT